MSQNTRTGAANKREYNEKSRARFDKYKRPVGFQKPLNRRGKFVLSQNWTPSPVVHGDSNNLSMNVSTILNVMPSSRSPLGKLQPTRSRRKSAAAFTKTTSIHDSKHQQTTHPIPDKRSSSKSDRGSDNQQTTLPIAGKRSLSSSYHVPESGGDNVEALTVNRSKTTIFKTNPQQSDCIEPSVVGKKSASSPHRHHVIEKDQPTVSRNTSIKFRTRPQQSSEEESTDRLQEIATSVNPSPTAHPTDNQSKSTKFRSRTQNVSDEEELIDRRQKTAASANPSPQSRHDIIEEAQPTVNQSKNTKFKTRTQNVSAEEELIDRRQKTAASANPSPQNRHDIIEEAQPSVSGNKNTKSKTRLQNVSAEEKLTDSRQKTAPTMTTESVDDQTHSRMEDLEKRRKNLSMSYMKFSHNEDLTLDPGLNTDQKKVRHEYLRRKRAWKDSSRTPVGSSTAETKTLNSPARPSPTTLEEQPKIKDVSLVRVSEFKRRKQMGQVTDLDVTVSLMHSMADKYLENEENDRKRVFLKSFMADVEEDLATSIGSLLEFKMKKTKLARNRRNIEHECETLMELQDRKIQLLPDYEKAVNERRQLTSDGDTSMT